MSAENPRGSTNGHLLWALVAAAALARLAFPGADPKFEYWVGWVTDEGRWVETARNLALFGEPRLYALSKLHLALGPGHQAAALASFHVFGVGLVPARLWTIFCAVALVVAVARAVGRIAPGWPAVLAVVAVGFEPLTVALSRTTLPEIPSLLFTLLAFLGLLAGRRRVLAAAAAGLLFAVALAMKATTVLVAPALVLAILFAGARESARERFVRLAAFCAAVGVPALAGLAAAYATGVMRFDSIAEVKAPLVAAFGFGGPYALLERLAVHRGSYGSVLVLLLLAWQGSWVAPFWREWRGTPLGEAYLHSGVWAATWLLGVGMLAYTPSRYSVHCLVPLAIHASAGIALWRQVGAGRVASTMSGARGAKGAFVEAWLWLPLGLSGGTAMMVLAAQAGIAFDRLSYRLAFGLAVALVLALAARRAGAARFDRGAVVTTVAAGTGAFLVDACWTGLVPGSGAGPALAFAKLAILASAVAWILARKKGGEEEKADSNRALGPVVVAVAAAFAVRTVPPLLLPTHSLQHASRALAERFAGARLVRSYAAGSLLVGTPLAYRDEDVRGTLPDAIVSVSPAFRPPEGFVKIGVLYVDTHPRFAVAARMNLEGGRVRADLYRGGRHATAPPGVGGPGDSRPLR